MFLTLLVKKKKRKKKKEKQLIAVIKILIKTIDVVYDKLGQFMTT